MNRLTNRLMRRVLGGGPSEVVRRARLEIERDLRQFHAHEQADLRAYVAEMRRRERAPHLALGECPDGGPYRLALEHLFAGTHLWATGSSNSGKTRLVAALIGEVLRLLLAGEPVAVIVVALQGDLVSLVLRTLGGLLLRASAARRNQVLSRLLVARFWQGSHLVPWDIFARAPGTPLIAHGNAVSDVLTHALGARIGHKQRPSLGFLISLMSESGLSANALRLMIDVPGSFAPLARRSSDSILSSYILNRFLRESSSVDGLASILDGLLGLDEGLRGALAGPGSIDFRGRFGPGSISLWDFSGGGNEARRALAGLTLNSHLDAALSALREVEGPTLLVIDEAQLAFTPSTATLLADALTTIRHGRVAVALVNQTLSNLPSDFTKLAATNVRYRWMGRSGESDAVAEFLPRTGTVPKAPKPFSPPGDRVEVLSRSEETAFRIAEAGALPQGTFFFTERSAPFGTRRFVAPRFDPPTWESLPADLRLALERGAWGVPRSELVVRGREVEAEVLRSLAAARGAEGSDGDGRRTTSRARRGARAPETPDAVSRATGWRRRGGTGS